MKLSQTPLGYIVLLTLFGLALKDAKAETKGETVDRPNILYLYVDDMGWGSIGPNGQSQRRAKGLPSVLTPNLDQLAARGLNFTRGYGCHVCSPARSSQQSGFHQGHTFADRNDPNNAKKAMRADDVLMGDALAKAGYVTGYWGKWGYGGSKDQAEPVIQNIQTLPTSHGYQHVLAELHHVRAHTFFQPTLWHAPAPDDAAGGMHLVPNSMSRYRNQTAYPNTPALQDHEEYPETAYCDDVYAFAALDFVRQQGQQYNQSGQPFFGLLAVQIPHAPFGEVSTLPEWDKEYADNPTFETLADQTKQWAAMVTRIDAHFGNLFAALDDPNHDGKTDDSIADNTLVIFQSDNGGPGGKNLMELDANGGLSGVKGKIQEGGIRVPLVMRWPAQINEKSSLQPGTSTDIVVDVTDLLPTFCDLAGAEVPLGIDGVSLAPTLTGEGHQRKREFVIHEAGNGQSIIRGNHKLVRSGKSKLALYDLSQDPSESQDIAGDNRELVLELEELLLGERVDEPRGFSNTYHHWTGIDGASASAADNWSDYEYSNAGVVYQTDRGTPQLSWVATMENQTAVAKTAVADSDLEFLAIEIRGASASQSLALGSSVNLVGRNEVRIGSQGVLSLDGGTVSSLRWVDIASGGTLQGSGRVEGDLLIRGVVELSSLQVHGDYRQSSNGLTVVSLTGKKRRTPLAVDGHAVLGGELSLKLTEGFVPPSGTRYTILSATQMSGQFDKITSATGVQFNVHYSDHGVSVSVK